ncbi:MAG: bile acid:sodium symporter [Cyanobacteriota bacterium]|nr:bile acid:sodium symporter [Cyanobacteriota bacterium]
MSLLRLLQQQLIWAVPGAMALGLIWGSLLPTDWLKALVIPLTFLMVYPMLVDLRLPLLFSGKESKVQLTAQAINFLVIPFLALAIGRWFFPTQPLLVLGLLLAALLPTSGMTISWTGFAKGNLEAAVQMTVVGLVLGSIATPFYAKWLLGAVVEVPLLQVFRQIVLIVFLPLLLGQITRAVLIAQRGKEHYQKVLKPLFPPFSTLGVLGIVFVAMALQARFIIGQPLVLVQMLIPLLMLYGINFVLSTLVGQRFFPRGDAIALVYGTVMRNLSIALALAMTAFGREQGAQIALIIALAYVVQVQAAAWYVRFSDQLFGPAPAQH